MYYRDAHGAVVVYDITDPKSLDRAKWWIAKLKENTDIDKMVIVVVGNMLDLASQRKVNTQKVESWCHSQGYLFAEASAKENINVTEIFYTVAEHIVHRCQLTGSNGPKADGFELEPEPKARGMCC